MNRSNVRQSVIGNVSSLDAGQVLLPAFVIKRSSGLYVDISALDSPELMQRFVERVFAENAIFTSLNYPLFLKLMFEYSPQDINQLIDGFEREGKPPEIKIAEDIVAFDPARREIYRGLKIQKGGESAEYFFEQVTIDVEFEEPIYGEEDEHGEYPQTGVERGTRAERAFLDFDEFVAAMWAKGLRYGIDETAVRNAIDTDRVDRIGIAAQKLAVSGQDSSIAELFDLMHRDDRPRMLAGGRMDLRQYSNRFPQVTAGTRLFSKVPRKLGVSGWSVQGRELSPEGVKDFDITTLAGPGTAVEKLANGDYCVVATIDGFLNIDTQTSQVAVSEKIVNRSGVSTRTTGDLTLSGDEFDEHGEVQEKRAVTGLHMNFFADVFGEITSNGGRVVFKQAISGGSANSPGGAISVEGIASCATLLARRGVVEVASAESTLIIGRVVRIKRAIRCDIVADQVEIEYAEGCSIAAKQIKLGESTARKSVPTQVLLMLPDIEPYEKAIAVALAERKAAEAELVVKQERLSSLAMNVDMKTYLSLEPRIRTKSLVMSPAQEANWKALLGRLGPALRDLQKIQADIKTVGEQIAGCAVRIEKLKAESKAASTGVGCQIDQVSGDTSVRGRRMRADAPALDSLPTKELRARMNESLDTDVKIFFDHAGSVSWPVNAAAP